MTRHINPKTRLRNHIVTQKAEEFTKEDKVVEEVLLEEEEEIEVRSKVLCLWKDRAHVLGMSREEE
jgi:hypothetical protein